MQQQQQRKRQQQRQRQQQRGHAGGAAYHSDAAYHSGAAYPSGAAYHSDAACVPPPPEAAVATYASATVPDGGCHRLGGYAPATVTDGGASWDCRLGRLGGGGVVGGLGGGGLLGSLGGGGMLSGLGGFYQDPSRAAEVRIGGREHENIHDAADADAYLGEIQEKILVESVRLTMLSLEQEIRAQDINDTRRKTKARGEPRVHTLLERVYMLNSSTTHTRV